MKEDVLSIIAVYSSELYGKRNHKNKKIIKLLFQVDNDYEKEEKNNKKEENK